MAESRGARASGRKPTVLIVVLLIAALAGAGVIAYAWKGSDEHHEAATAVAERDGVPVVARARCGRPLPLKAVTIRVAPGNGSEPTDDDPVVFRAIATGDGLAEVPVAEEVTGYDVEWFGPLQADDRYYVEQTRYLTASGDGAPTFSTTDLSADRLLVLYPLPESGSQAGSRRPTG